MDSFLAAIAGLFVGVFCMLVLCSSYVNDTYRKPMDALGIERFQKCEINTTNCHSNWYEIVYKEKNK